MIRIPIRIRQFPQFITSSARRSAVLRRPDPGPRTFHLCYFTCGSYFPYLYCSLHSLATHIDTRAIRVWVFSDVEQPLSADQTAAVAGLFPSARVLPWPKSVGWGITQIQSIWEAYDLVAQNADADDVVARVDSDVFFFNDRIFRAVVRSEADIIGDGHYDDFAFCQGGCVFFKVTAIRKVVAAIASHGLPVLLDGLDTLVDDRAAHHIATRLGLKVWMIWFMMFPDELRNAGGLTAWARWKFSCLHCVYKDKGLMLDAYRREVLRGADLDEFRRALATA